jgi:hypothetical protein
MLTTEVVCRTSQARTRMSFLLFFPKAGLIRSDERKKTLDSKKPQLLGRRGEHKKKKKKVERGAQRRTFSCLSPSSVLSRECHLGFVGLSGGAEGAGEGGSCIVLAVIIATTLLLAVFFSFLCVCGCCYSSSQSLRERLAAVRLLGGLKTPQ